MHFGCNVSSIALLGAVLDSARRVPGYDPSDVVVMESSVPAGELGAGSRHEGPESDCKLWLSHMHDCTVGVLTSASTALHRHAAKAFGPLGIDS